MPPTRLDPLAHSLSERTIFRELELELGSSCDRIDTELAFVSGFGEIAAERVARSAGDVEMAELGNEFDPVDRVPDQARLIAELLAAVDVEGRAERGRTAVDVVGQ